MKIILLGAPGAGKSTFLRTIACAAAEKSGRLLFVDRVAATERKTAELVQADYFTTNVELYDLTKTLLLETNARGAKRKQLMERELETEELYAEMQEFPPIFCFISDFRDFLQRVYSNAEGIGKLAPSLEPIFEKGKLLNVYFFVAINRQDIPAVMDLPIYNSFIRGGQGVVLGGELNKQTVFVCQNVKYAEQGKRQNPGFGYAVDENDSQSLNLIVIPQNRGGGAQ